MLKFWFNAGIIAKVNCIAWPSQKPPFPLVGRLPSMVQAVGTTIYSINSLHGLWFCPRCLAAHISSRDAVNLKQANGVQISSYNISLRIFVIRDPHVRSYPQDAGRHRCSVGLFREFLLGPWRMITPVSTIVFAGEPNWPWNHTYKWVRCRHTHSRRAHKVAWIVEGRKLECEREWVM